MCDCKSNNRPDTGGNKEEIVLNPNVYFDWGFHAKPVYLDSCIANEVITLWKNGIWTLGSCCGHNGHFQRSIIIEEHVDANKARELTPAKTTIKQWRLVDVYNQPTYYDTIVHSQEWQAWVKYQEKAQEFDVHESMECGWLSPEHFQAFLKWNNGTLAKPDNQ